MDSFAKLHGPPPTRKNYTTFAGIPCGGRSDLPGVGDCLSFVRAGCGARRELNGSSTACSAVIIPLRLHYSVICTRHFAVSSLTMYSAEPTLSAYLSEDSVRSMARSCLVVLLVTGLLDIPAFAAAAEKPLGMVIQAQEAQLDNAKLVVGTSIYGGDTVVTDAGGGVRLKMGDSQLYLLAESAATLSQNAAVVRAVVARGTVGFSS